MNLLAQPRRPQRPEGWSSAKAVTFIVTLARSRSVTLAARAVGMSRKSAYALRKRDPGFAAAWNAAIGAGSILNPKGNSGRQSQHSQPSQLAVTQETAEARRRDELLRDRFFARLAATRRKAGQTPHRSPAMRAPQCSRDPDLPPAPSSGLGQSCC
jgi:hypothetical protein